MINNAAKRAACAEDRRRRGTCIECGGYREPSSLSDLCPVCVVATSIEKAKPGATVSDGAPRMLGLKKGRQVYFPHGR
jgi:hypothetical protein